MKRLPRASYVSAIVIVASTLLFGCVAGLLHKRGMLFDRDDPLGYYVYLRSLVHDGDLDFTNELAHFAQYPGAPGPSLGTVVPRTGLPDNNYTIGFPLLAAPVYVASSTLFAHLYPTGQSIERFPWFADQVLFSCASLVLGWIGMWLSFRLAALCCSQAASTWATWLVWACSPLPYYFIREPFQSHLAALLAVSAMLYLWQRPGLRTAWRFGPMGLAAGCVIITRQQDAVIVLALLAAAAWTGPTEGDSRSVSGKAWLSFVCGCLAVLAAQMIVWKVLRGEFLSFAYRDQSFPFLAAPRWREVLFSSNHGLLTWHPVFAFCLVGLVLLYRKHRALAVAGLIALAGELLVISSWWSWWMGQSFGQRGFLSLTPLFIVGLAALVERLNGSRAWPWFLAMCAVLLAWNVILMASYLTETIPHQGEFSWTQFIERVPDLPHRIAEKLGSV